MKIHPLVKVTIICCLTSGLALVITFPRSPTLPKLVQIRSAVATPGDTGPSCDLSLHDACTPHLSRTVDQKTRSGAKKCFFLNSRFFGHFPPKPPNFLCVNNTSKLISQLIIIILIHTLKLTCMPNFFPIKCYLINSLT